jgi:hypothetical protein
MIEGFRAFERLPKMAAPHERDWGDFPRNQQPDVLGRRNTLHNSGCSTHTDTNCEICSLYNTIYTSTRLPHWSP